MAQNTSPSQTALADYVILQRLQKRVKVLTQRLGQVPCFLCNEISVAVMFGILIEGAIACGTGTVLLATEVM